MYLLYDSEILYNIISVNWARQNGVRSEIEHDETEPNMGILKMIYMKTNIVKMAATETSNGLYEALIYVLNPERLTEAAFITQTDLNIWHETLRHLSMLNIWESISYLERLKYLHLIRTS